MHSYSNKSNKTLHKLIHMYTVHIHCTIIDHTEVSLRYLFSISCDVPSMVDPFQSSSPDTHYTQIHTMNTSTCTCISTTMETLKCKCKMHNTVRLLGLNFKIDNRTSPAGKRGISSPQFSLIVQ